MEQVEKLEQDMESWTDEEDDELKEKCQERIQQMKARVEWIEQREKEEEEEESRCSSMGSEDKMEEDTVRA